MRRIAKGIRGGKIGKVMKPYRRADGYNMYILRHDNRSFHKKAHQLIAEAFIGPKPFPKAEVCHEDGDRANDTVENLRWDTRKNNGADMVKHGTSRRGAAHGAAKMTDEKVRELFALASKGYSHSRIGSVLGIRQAQVSRIINGERWITPEADELRRKLRESRAA